MKEGRTTAGLPPAVVAVVVTRQPCALLDDTLAALGAQDYQNLSVLVLGSGDTDRLEARVAAHLPSAFVGHLDDDRGYGTAVARALEMVEGASYFLLCHDDCAPEPDAVHVMVEESFRSNAGIVSPKMVRWDDPAILLHVGQNVDKTGAVVERVQPAEIDAGQHDAVRDVFVAPGGCLLARADLLATLGGYDPQITAMGEDLDLSWRAHVAGARVVVAPGARVRHRELVAGGLRPPAGPLGGQHLPSLRALQRRHELRAVLTCYAWPHLLRVLPQAAVLAVGEVVTAALVGDRARAAAVLGAWWWNLCHLGDVRRRRASLAAVRAVGDHDVRSLQVRGSARLGQYVARLAHYGIDVAHGLGMGRATMPGSLGLGLGMGPGEGAGAGFGEGSGAGLGEGSGFGDVLADPDDLDDLDDLGRRSDRSRPRARNRFLGSRRARLVAWLVTILILVLGTRGILGSGLPFVGQYLPFTSWTGTWHHLFSSWQVAGTGSGAASSPGFGLLGLLGTIAFGRMGFLQEAVVLGCVPIGAWGLSRLLGPFGSPRARFCGVVAYLALPLAWDALARGRWDGLVVYAAAPWVVGHLARASGLAPFHGARFLPARRWRGTLLGRCVALGVLEAAAASVVPGMAVVVLVCALGIAAVALAAGQVRSAGRVATVSVGATVVTAVLFTPWVVATVAAGRSGLAVFGLPGSPVSHPGWGGLLRMAVGPIGGSPLSWLLLAAAVVPLLMARRERLVWAGAAWGIGLAGWLLALVAARGWLTPFAPSVDVMLAPAAVAVAACCGLGVSAFESDVAGHRFGWRQTIAAGSVVVLAAGLVPTLAEAANGRWGLPAGGIEQAVSFPAASASSPGYRVLWLGGPQAIPGGGWSLGPGLAYTTSVNGLPDLKDLWAPASPGRGVSLSRPVREALRGETVLLGRLLAPAGIRFVVVTGAVAPQPPGDSGGVAVPVVSGLRASLARQEDLSAIPVGTDGVTVFENTDPALARFAGVGIPSPGGRDTFDTYGAVLELVLWAVVAAALLGRRRWLDWWWVPLVRRRRVDRGRRRAVAAVAGSVEVASVGAGSDEVASVGAGSVEAGSEEVASVGAGSDEVASVGAGSVEVSGAGAAPASLSHDGSDGRGTQAVPATAVVGPHVE